DRLPSSSSRSNARRITCWSLRRQRSFANTATPLSSQRTASPSIRQERTQVARRRGWAVVEVYSDALISGAKGRNGRPGLDSMLKDASRRKFDIVMAWAIDRLARHWHGTAHLQRPSMKERCHFCADREVVCAAPPGGGRVKFEDCSSPTPRP